MAEAVATPRLRYARWRRRFWPRLHAGGRSRWGSPGGDNSAAVLVVRAGGGYGRDGPIELVDLPRGRPRRSDPRSSAAYFALHTAIFTRPDAGGSSCRWKARYGTEVSELPAPRVAEEPFDGADDDQTVASGSTAGAGRENLEERLIRPRSVDPVLVEALRRAAKEKVGPRDVPPP